MAFTKHGALIVIESLLGTIAYVLALQWIWQQDIDGEYMSVFFAAFSSLLITYPIVCLQSISRSLAS